MMKALKTIFIFTASLALASFAGNLAAKHLSQKNTEQRIQPVHSVYLEGDEVPTVANAAPISAEPTGPRTAEDIYNASCMACHDAGIAGAPKLGDSAVWETRTSNGIDAVYNNAINGLNAMPPRGTCADCSDDEIKAVVDYLIKGSN